MKVIKILVTIIALLCAVWFALTSWMSVYAIWLSYPFGLAALLLYFIGRFHSPGSKLNQAVLWILIVGLAVSIIGQYWLIKSS